MKKLLFLIALLAIVTSATAQMKVLSNGNVIIGSTITSSTEKLYLNGSIRLKGWKDLLFDWTGDYAEPTFYPTSNYGFQIGKNALRLNNIYAHNLWLVTQPHVSSDERIKENITPIENPISKIKQVSGYYYNLKKEIYPEDFPEEAILAMSGKQIGFLAQEVEKVFPELVITPKSEEDFYSISYEGMIPVLLEAIKEQHTQIEQLQNMFSKQESEMKLLKEQLEVNFYNNSDNSSFQNMFMGENLIQNKEGKLFQNTPNPFSVNTEIRFEISERSSSARLLIHDMQGAEVKSYPISAKGSGSITIQGSELQVGMYMYTLLVNNTIVDSKRMILTK